MLTGPVKGTLKPERIVVAGVLCLMLVASPAFASSGNVRQSQSLSLTLQGVITNAGNQHYDFSGGKLVHGSLFGQSLTSGQVSFNLDASVRGLQDASGGGTLQISSGGGHGSSGGHSGGQGDANNGAYSGGSFSARITITGELPAAVFPITLSSDGSTYTNCDPETQTCNSEIPLFFTGLATVQSKGGSAPLQIPIAIESPYWNPFGGPILIRSLDGSSPSILLVVSYDHATIDWAGVQLQGMLSGTFGKEGVAGAYGQVVSSLENLVSAKEVDLGSIAFVNMNDSTLNAQGWLAGRTTFSLAGSFDCAPEFDLYVRSLLGFGMPKGTCMATGATSDGLFGMNAGQGTRISGTYHTVWSVPSLFTLTTVIGAVSQH